MKKKDLLSNLSEYITSQNTDEESADFLAGKLSYYFAKISLISLLVYFVFLIYAAVNYNFVDELSNISVNSYLILTIILVVLSTVVFGGFLSLYIYNKQKKFAFSPKHLKIFDIFYQIYDIVNFIGLFLTVFLWMIIFIVTPVEISGQSMEDTLSEGDKVLVWRVFYEPQLYDIVVIDANEHYTFTQDTEFIIKRIMANSGDYVELRADGIYYINGRPVRKNISQDEFKMMLTDCCSNEEKNYYWEFDSDSKTLFGTVPEGFCIALGDNRNNSMDSKSVGLFHNEDVLGKAIYRIYPFDKIGVPIGEMK